MRIKKHTELPVLVGEDPIPERIWTNMSILRSFPCPVLERVHGNRYSKDWHLKNPACFYFSSESSRFSPKLEHFTKLDFHNNAGNGLMLLQSGKKSIFGNFKAVTGLHGWLQECELFWSWHLWKGKTLVFVQVVPSLSNPSKIQQSGMEVNITVFLADRQVKP